MIVQIVCKMFSQGYEYPAIAVELERHGLRTRIGTRWSRQALRHLHLRTLNRKMPSPKAQKERRVTLEIDDASIELVLLRFMAEDDSERGKVAQEALAAYEKAVAEGRRYSHALTKAKAIIDTWKCLRASGGKVYDE